MINGKEVTEYCFSSRIHSNTSTTHEEFLKQPATAFLSFVLDAKDAIEECKTRFTKLPNYHLTRDSYSKIQNIINSTLASIMGYFETYEKHTFARIFELTTYFHSFNATKFFSKICDDRYVFPTKINNLLAYRSSPTSVGLIVADCLSGWHNPNKVNEYFKAYWNNTAIFTSEDVNDLELLWQFRHSIVHTAGTITMPDAQKNPKLREFGNRDIIFTNKFIYELSKRFHNMVYNANARIETKLNQSISGDVPQEEKQKMLNYFAVKSKNAIWLR